VQVDAMSKIHDATVYTRIEDFPQVKQIIDNLNKGEERKIEVQHLRLQVTDLGKQFIRACVIDKDAQPRS
jgi:hypothetical protein